MAAGFRMAAVAGDDTTEVQALIEHPMDSGFAKDEEGRIIPPHYIEVVEFAHAGKTVLRAFLGSAVAKNPYVKFSFKGGKKGDDLAVSWVDNKGERASFASKIQ